MEASYKEGDESFVRETAFSYKLSKSFQSGMKVPGRVFVNETLQKALRDELAQFHANSSKSFVPSLHQIAQVAALPGIVGASIGLPDIHSGYGFAIGSVAAFDINDPEAVVSPGGVGFDINCGVRLLRTNLRLEDVRSKIDALLDELYARVPLGIDSKKQKKLMNEAKVKSIDRQAMIDLMKEGMPWAVRNGLAWPEDVAFCEDNGKMEDADPLALGQMPLARGSSQLGTLGSGNHYLEIQYVDEIYDQEAATAMGIGTVGQVCIMIHCGSRGVGHGFASDIIREIVAKDLSSVPDNEALACVPISSPLGKRYLSGMAAAANYAFVNRSAIAVQARAAFAKIFTTEEDLQVGARHLGMHLVYDVAHNIAKLEEHRIDGWPEKRKLLVHRKGASRAFPPGHPSLPPAYQSFGQPVLVGGSMGTCRYYK